LTINANKFVHLALNNTLTLAIDLKGPGVTDALLKTGLQIYIVGGNDFYSQRVTVRRMNSAGRHGWNIEGFFPC
jgi:phosphomevalonate kinase